MKAERAQEKHHSFIADIQEIRRRAREHMEKGAVTEGYKADREIRLRPLVRNGHPSIEISTEVCKREQSAVNTFFKILTL